MGKQCQTLFFLTPKSLQMVTAAMKKIFFFYFILLYNTVLVLPYINMNSPRVYTCSQSWTTYLLNFIDFWPRILYSCDCFMCPWKKQVHSSVTGYNVLRTDHLYPYRFLCLLVQTISVGRVKIFNFIFEFGLFLSLVLSVLLHLGEILLLSTYMFKIMFSCWDYPLSV